MLAPKSSLCMRTIKTHSETVRVKVPRGTGLAKILGLGQVCGLRPAPRQPVSGNHATPGPVLIRIGMLAAIARMLNILVSDQIRKLAVRLLIDMFDLRVERSER